MKKAIFLLLMAFTVFARAQDNKRWGLTLHGGLPVMQGDGKIDVSDPSYAGGLSLRYVFANNFSIRLMAAGGQMRSKDLNSNSTTSSPYKSSTMFYEGSAQAILNIVNFKNARSGKNVAQLYVLAGAGYMKADLKYDPTTPTVNGEKPPKETSSLAIPYGVGMRFYVSSTVDLGMEYSQRMTFSDYVDGYKPSGQVGNNFNDFYSLPNVYVTFNLGKEGERALDWTEPTEKLYDELLKAKKEAEDQIAALKKENDALLLQMKQDMLKQAADNQRKADSSIASMKESIKGDKDTDGVADLFDKEPNTVAGAIVDGSGRTLDVDKDGVPDHLDKCPTVPGKASGSGCPLQPTKAQLATISDGIKNLQFEVGKAVIKSSSYPALDNLASMLVENSTFAFRIEGHTDNVGNAQSNMTLSKERAESVKAYLIARGVDANRITAVGYGDTKPVVSNATAAGKAKNRRVDMTIE
jgi:OOP family OmpA-OmpF porin